MSTSMIFDTVGENIVLYALVIVAVLMIAIVLGIVLWALCKKIRSCRSHKNGDKSFLEPSDLMKIKINDEVVTLKRDNNSNLNNIKNRLRTAVDKLYNLKEAGDDTKKVLDQLSNRLKHECQFDSRPLEDGKAEPQSEDGTTELN